MEAHHNGYTIRITPFQSNAENCWTFSALVVWNHGDQQRTKLFLRHGCHFTSENDALKRALEIVTIWIDRRMDAFVFLLTFSAAFQ
jgi:hypothetical protein